MEQKNRLLITLAIIVVIVGAMFTSFGRSLLSSSTPSVKLPDLSTGAGDSTSSSSQAGSSQYQDVEVTPSTVQNVIETLARSDSYYQELTVETFWDGGTGAIPVQVWVDGGWSHSIQILPSGLIRHDLVGADTLYYWYDGSDAYESAPADEFSSDFAQRLPTYETVLDLDVNDIVSAGYELRGDLPCVYVEVSQKDSHTLQRYWVSVDSGLLVSAETELVDAQEQLTYRMTAYAAIQSPCPPTASFQLPDGDVLHIVS